MTIAELTSRTIVELEGVETDTPQIPVIDWEHDTEEVLEEKIKTLTDLGLFYT
jgi:hypothetical protein